MAILDFFKRAPKKRSEFTKNWKLSPKELFNKWQALTKNSYPGLVNPANGLGGPSDVTIYNENTTPKFYSFQELDNVYRNNFLAQRIINAPAEDMTRKWREFLHDDVNVLEKRTKAEKEFYIKDMVKDAVRYANLYGGAGLLICLKGERQKFSEPLDISKIMKGQLIKFQPIFLGEMYSAGAIEMDPSSPYFGTPEYYIVNNMATQVHRSRLIVFEGVQLSLYAKITRLGFGDSKLQSCMDVLQSTQMTYLNIANLIARANIDVIAIKDFALLASNDPEKIFSMLSAQSSIRNNLNIMTIDSEDDFKRHEITGIGSLDKVLMSFIELIAAVIPMPITKLIGTSVEGFGTGENELIQYYDDIHGKQMDITPQLKFIDEIVERSTFGKKLDIDYDWVSLYTPNAADKANVDFQTMQTIISAVNAGLVSEEAAAQKIKQLGMFDGMTDEFIASLSTTSTSTQDDEEMQELLKKITDEDGKEDTNAKTNQDK